MSRTGVSVKASNPLTLIKGFSTETSSATVTPIGFGLGGNLVANIPTAFYSLLGVSRLSELMDMLRPIWL